MTVNEFWILDIGTATADLVLNITQAYILYPQPKRVNIVAAVTRLPIFFGPYLAPGARGRWTPGWGGAAADES